MRRQKLTRSHSTPANRRFLALWFIAYHIVSPFWSLIDGMSEAQLQGVVSKAACLPI